MSIISAKRLGKPFANAAESIVLAAGPVAALFLLGNLAPGLWKFALFGALGFIAAAVFGQHIVLRQITVRLKASIPPGLDEDHKREYLLKRAIPIGALIAGICEETARYILLSWLLPASAAGWEVIAFGLGHGGLEAVLLGLFIGIVGVLDAVIPGRMAGITLDGIRRHRSSEHWWGIIERCGIVLKQLLWTLFVARAVLTGNILWYLLAIIMHAGFDYWVTKKPLLDKWPVWKLQLLVWGFVIGTGAIFAVTNPAL